MAQSPHDSDLGFLPDSASPEELSPSGATGSPAGPGTSGQEPTVWLNEGVLTCICPECSALVSIRSWLMLGDCTRCGASIELTEEQEQQALRLLEGPAMPGPATARASVPERPPRRRPVEPVKPRPAVPKRPGPAPAPAAAPRQRKRSTPATAWPQDGFHDLSAWSLSIGIHLLLCLVLAFWMRPEPIPQGGLMIRRTNAAAAKTATAKTSRREGSHDNSSRAPTDRRGASPR